MAHPVATLLAEGRAAEQRALADRLTKWQDPDGTLRQGLERSRIIFTALRRGIPLKCRR